MSNSQWSDGRSHMSGQAMDERRKENVAYEYLCHLEEARVWMGKCLEEELPAATALEPALTNGVYLAKLAHFFAPTVVNVKKIYDIELTKFNSSGLHFKHTDNINFWLKAMDAEGLPSIFYPTTTDIYDRKNIPKLIYCLHALGIFLYRQGKAPPVQDLVGEAEFTQEEISNMQRELDEQNIQMPAFGGIGGILADVSDEPPAIVALNDLIREKKLKKLYEALRNEELAIENVIEENCSFYLKNFTAMMGKKAGEDLDRFEVQECVDDGNTEADYVRDVQERMININVGMKTEDPEAFYEALCDPVLALQDVHRDHVQYYMDEYRKQMEENERELTLAEIGAIIAAGNEEAARIRERKERWHRLNEGLKTDDEDSFYEALCDPMFNVQNVEREHVKYYMDEHLKIMETGDFNRDLMPEEVDAMVAAGNAEAARMRDLAERLHILNEGLKTDDAEAFYEALCDPVLSVENVKKDNVNYYMAEHLTLMEVGDANRDLTRAEIDGMIDAGNAEADRIQDLADRLKRLNAGLKTDDEDKFHEALCDPVLDVKNVGRKNTSFYIPVHKKMMEGQDADKEFTMEEIQKMVEEGNTEALRHADFEERLHSMNQGLKTDDVDKFYQALCDPVLGLEGIKRENVTFYMSAYQKETEAGDKDLTVPEMNALIAQGNKDAEHYRDVQRRVKALNDHIRANDEEKFYEGLLDPVLDIKNVNKENMSFYMKMCSSLMEARGRDLTLEELQAAIDVDDMAGGGGSSQKVQVSSLQKFLHLLEANERDYEEEREIQKIKQSVVSTIRHQQELEENLNIMDIKIGLLVKNRLDLDDVVHQQTKLKKKKLDAGAVSKGIKSLSKESREKLEGYQHLFYALQTNPSYLARLIFQMPGGRTTRFIENVIFTLFNYASNQREEYLLMKLFESALNLELKTMDSVEDIAKGNATVIKMVITFNRGARGVSSLKELILPLVTRIINDKDIRINVSPIEVYKAWINQRESETGESCGMPYDVSVEQALSHAEVRERIDKTVKLLTDITEEFVSNLTESNQKIPYGIRYFSMRLREALTAQFPGATKEEVLKVVGNLLYYRFMNPAVVAPDAFDIVELSLDKGGLTNEQRRNLGSIAKVLHHASANKNFDGENSPLSPLNPVIGTAHKKFLKFFEMASTTEDAESHYNQDKYAEVTQLAKPVVYISVKEICNTHKLLLEHQEQITDSDNDIMHKLLKELGPVPEVHEILGDSYAKPAANAPADYVAQWEDRVAEGGKSEISLTLKSGGDVIGQDDKDNILTIFLQTKRMAAGILQAQPGPNLKVILQTPATPEQEAEFARIQERKRAFEKKREQQEADDAKKSGEKGDKPESTPKADPKNTASLSDMKEALRVNLHTLEKEQLVESSNNYQAILNSMAKDIRNQHRHRQQRKKELEGLMNTLAALEAKGKYYEDQKDYYQMYVDACLSNLTKPKSGKKVVTRKSIKYNASKLHEKGVLLEIEGLSTGQFKGVSFEIESGDTGKFNVYAKFMGVSMEKVELVFEDLLQLQYEGVSVFKMYGCAKINVNLLVFLINKKFYGT